MDGPEFDYDLKVRNMEFSSAKSALDPLIADPILLA